jgi:hypothetical protein
MHNTPPSAIRLHGGTTHQNCREAFTKSRRVAPEGLRSEVTYLPSCQLGIHSRQYGFNTSQLGVWERTPPAL